MLLPEADNESHPGNVRHSETHVLEHDRNPSQFIDRDPKLSELSGQTILKYSERVDSTKTQLTERSLDNLRYRLRVRLSIIHSLSARNKLKWSRKINYSADLLVELCQV
jgi:hypothetical protein